MPVYQYKGFEMSYLIRFNNELSYYEALGTIAINTPDLFIKEFQTDNKIRAQAIHEIKKLMESFIDFEWKQASLVSQNT